MKRIIEKNSSRLSNIVKVQTPCVVKSKKSNESSIRITQTTCDIAMIWDVEILKNLLEKVTTIEERRRIHARVRELLTKQRALKAKKNCTANENQKLTKEVTDFSNDEEKETNNNDKETLKSKFLVKYKQKLDNSNNSKSLANGTNKFENAEETFEMDVGAKITGKAPHNLKENFCIKKTPQNLPPLEPQKHHQKQQQQQQTQQQQQQQQQQQTQKHILHDHPHQNVINNAQLPNNNKDALDYQQKLQTKSVERIELQQRKQEIEREKERLTNVLFEIDYLNRQKQKLLPIAQNTVLSKLLNTFIETSQSANKPKQQFSNKPSNAKVDVHNSDSSLGHINLERQAEQIHETDALIPPRTNLSPEQQHKQQQKQQQQQHQQNKQQKRQSIVGKSSLPKIKNFPILKKFELPQRHHYMPNAYQNENKTNSKMTATATVATKIKNTPQEIIKKTTLTKKPSIVQTSTSFQSIKDAIPRNIVSNCITTFNRLLNQQFKENGLEKCDTCNEMQQHNIQTTQPASSDIADVGNSELAHIKFLEFPKLYEASIDKSEIDKKAENSN